MRDQFPIEADVAKADRITICRWYRFLPSPRDPEEVVVMDLILKRFGDLGGMTPEISKAIGWVP